MTSTNIPGLQTFIDAMIALAIAIGCWLFSYYVHDGDRAHSRHRRAEISRRKSVVHRARALDRIRRALFVGNRCRCGFELCVRAHSLRASHVVDSDYSGMDSSRRGIASREPSSGELSGMDGEPQDAVERCLTTSASKMAWSFLDLLGRKEKDRKSRENRESLGTNGNRSYNTRTCRRADFPGKKSVDPILRTENLWKLYARQVEVPPCAGEFRSAAAESVAVMGFRLRQVFAALCDRRPRASLPRESPG